MKDGPTHAPSDPSSSSPPVRSSSALRHVPGQQHSTRLTALPAALGQRSYLVPRDAEP